MSDNNEKVYSLDFSALAHSSEKAGFGWGLAIADYHAERKRGGEHVEKLRAIADKRQKYAEALKAAVVAYLENERADEILRSLKP